MENEKKFINVKLYGEKPSIVIPPRKNGAKNKTKNLLFSKVVNYMLYHLVIKFKIFFSILFIFK